MSGDEQFDREIRSALHDLASHAAPDRLVDRVASIPSRAPAFAPRRSFMRIATALAAAAVIVVVAAAVIVTRPGGSSPIAGAPATSSAVPTTPASAPATTSPSAAPSAAPAGIPVPAGFQAVSVTFASPDLGWVLGTAQCSAPPCTSSPAHVRRRPDLGRDSRRRAPRSSGPGWRRRRPWDRASAGCGSPIPATGGRSGRTCGPRTTVGRPGIE